MKIELKNQQVTLEPETDDDIIMLRFLYQMEPLFRWTTEAQEIGYLEEEDSDSDLEV